MWMLGIAVSVYKWNVMCESLRLGCFFVKKKEKQRMGQKSVKREFLIKKYIWKQYVSDAIK